MTNTATLAPASYPIPFEATDGIHTDRDTFYVTVVHKPSLLLPQDGEGQTTLNELSFQWSEVEGAIGYVLQFSESPDFFTPLFEYTLSNPSYTPLGEIERGMHLYWRVNAIFECGESGFTPPRYFMIPGYCVVYEQTKDTILPPHPGGNVQTVYSQLNVPDTFYASTVRVKQVHGYHYRSWMQAGFILHRDTQQVTLFYKPLHVFWGQTLDIGFDDNGQPFDDIPDYPIDQELYRPLGPGELSSMKGLVNGDWELEMHSASNTPLATRLYNWSLEFCNDTNRVTVINPAVQEQTLVADHGTSTPVSSSSLLTTDANNTPEELVYTVASFLQNGALYHEGQMLSIGHQFTQANIDSGHIYYVHNGSATTSDACLFTVNDGQGGITGVETLDITIAPQFFVNSGSNETICPGNSTTIGGSPSASGGIGPYTYLWSPGGMTDANPTVTPTVNTTYTLAVTDATGRTKTDDVLVKVGDPNGLNFEFCPADVNGCASIIAWSQPVVEDNCNIITLTSNYSSGTFLPVGTTNIVYTASDNNGNSATCSFNVTRHSNTVTVDAGADETIAGGASANLGGSPTASNGTPGYTYSWTPAASLDDATVSNPVATPVATTNYVLVVTDVNGCSSFDMKRVTIDGTAATCARPTGNNVTNITPIGATVGWNDVAGASIYQVQYQLETGGGTGTAVSNTSQKTLTNLLPGNRYRYRIRANCGSIGMSSWRFGYFFTPALRQDANQDNLKMTLFPNPAKEHLHISLEDLELDEQVTIRIFNQRGQQLYLWKGEENLHQIDLGKFVAGSYYLSVENSAGKVSKVFVVE